MRRLALAPLALLAACATTPGAVEVREVRVPTPVACVSADAIPPEPAKVGGQLAGDAVTDSSILAASALELRKWGQELSALLTGCAD